MKRLFCVITGIDENVRDSYLKDFDYGDVYFNNTDIGRIIMAKLIGKYNDGEYEYVSPIGTFAVTPDEMNGATDANVGECVLRCFTDIHDATNLAKQLRPQDSNGYGVNFDNINEHNTMKGKAIRLTESQLHRVIKESVKRILSESGDSLNGQKNLGALSSARFHGKRKGDWSEPAMKASMERIKKGPNGKQSSDMIDAYNEGWRSQEKGKGKR